MEIDAETVIALYSLNRPRGQNTEKKYLDTFLHFFLMNSLSVNDTFMGLRADRPWPATSTLKKLSVLLLIALEITFYSA